MHFGSSQPPVSFKLKAVASLIRETWAITPTNLLKKNLTYSSIFKAYFTKIFAAAKASLVFVKNRCRNSHSQMFFKIGVLKKFAVFTGKHQLWSLFLIKLETWKSAKRFQYWAVRSVTWLCEIFLKPLWNEGKQPRIFNSEVSPQWQVDSNNQTFLRKKTFARQKGYY